MKQMYPLLTTPVIVFFFMGLTSIAQVRPKHDIPAQPGVEVPALRDAYAKHYRQADGTMQAVICAGRVHYQDDKGRWQDIHTQLTPSSAPGMAYENTTNAITSAFPASGGAAQGVVIDAGDGLSLQMGMELKLEAFAADGSFLGVIEHASSSQAAAANAANTVEYPGVFSNATNTYEVHRAKVKNNLILHSAINSVPAMTAYVGFTEVIALPFGVEIIANGEVVHQPTITGGAIQFISAGSDESLQIPVPEIYELDNPAACVSPMGQYEMAYRIEPLGNKRYKLTTFTPLAWLADGARNYPVVVDPTVVLSGNWGGVQSVHSNWVYYFNANPTDYVFISYDYGGENSRGYIQWDISTLPLGASISDLELRMVMHLSGNSVMDTIYINRISSAYGPYGSYSSTVFDDLGDEIFTSYEALDPGVYGYYSLGSQANVELENSVANGEFQLGFSMHDEALQTFKRFRSDSARLRITYTPCVSPIISTLTSTTNSFGYQISCHGDSSGVITLGVTGGGSTYEFVWSDTGGNYLDTIQNPTGLGAGMYIVTVFLEVYAPLLIPSYYPNLRHSY